VVIGSKRPLLATMHRVRVLQTIHGGMARRRWEIAELLVMAMIKEGTMSEKSTATEPERVFRFNGTFKVDVVDVLIVAKDEEEAMRNLEEWAESQLEPDGDIECEDCGPVDAETP